MTNTTFKIMGLEIQAQKFSSIDEALANPSNNGRKSYAHVSDAELIAACERGSSAAAVEFNQRGMNPNLKNYRGF